MQQQQQPLIMGSAPQEDGHSKTQEAAGIVANPSSSRVIITFKKTHVPMLDDDDDDDASGSDSTGDSPLPPGRRKRPARRRYAGGGYSSEDEQELFPRSVRHKVTNFHESDSSSEADTGFKGPLPPPAPPPPRFQTATSKPDLPMGVIRGCESCEDCQKVVASWRPSAGRKPCLDEAPAFFPDEEEFKDPLKYISSIRTRAEPYGICRVVPPQSWRPPCMLRQDSPDVQNMRFPTRVQQVHKLQVREHIAKECSLPKAFSGGKEKRGQQQSSSPGRIMTMTAEATPCDNSRRNRTSGNAPCDSQASDDQESEYFGFEPGNLFSLAVFEKYADAFKEHYFQRKETLAGCQSGKTAADKPWEPSVDLIEGEYWRIVEQPTEQIEVLYGADVETGKFGSGFPKAAKHGQSTMSMEVESTYEKSGWNLNNIARLPGSMLTFEEEDISGVVVPWLYIGMCFSSFCWHVEDHHFYSLNYMHWGAPKVWYGIPSSEALKLESVMKKRLPELFNEQPDLLHKLVTQLSPTVLKDEGVPVYKLVQQAGDFVITFPRAYHSGFNCGFNVAEAVNVAPADWLSHGQSAVELYCEQRRKTSVSHDKLLLRAARLAVKLFWHFHHRNLHEKDWAAASVSTAQLQVWAGAAASGQVVEKMEAARILSAWQALFGQGGMLSKALKVRVEMEHARRASLKNMGEIAAKKMDSRYDATDERECEVCKYDLHLSAIGCKSHPERFSCLLHAAVVCSCPWSKKMLLYRYDSDQLELLVSAVEGNAGAVREWTGQEIRQAASLPLGTFEERPRSATQIAAVCGSSTNYQPDVQHSSRCQKESSPSMGFNEKYRSTQVVVDDEKGSVISARAATPHVAEGFRKLETHQGLLDALPTGKIATYSVTPPVGRNDEGLSTANESQKQTDGKENEARAGPDAAAQLQLGCRDGIPAFLSRQQQSIPEQRRILSGSPVAGKQTAQLSSPPKQPTDVIILSDDEDEEENLQARVGPSAQAGASQGACSLHDQVIMSTVAGRPDSHSRGRALPETGLDGRVDDSDASTDQSRERRVSGEISPPVVVSCGLAKSACAAAAARPRLGLAILSTVPAPATSVTPRHVELEVVLDQSVNAKPDLPTGMTAIARETRKLPPESCRPVTSSGPGVLSLDSAIGCPSSTTGRADSFVNSIGLTSDKTGIARPGARSDTWTPGPPRHIARVVHANREVELLNVGSLVLRTSWQSKRAIYPAGFKSRTRFISVRDISQTCMYESEIVDNGPQSGPLFKVSLPNVEPFVSASIDECWSEVRKSVNDEICRRRGRYGQGRLAPPLLPPVNALEMFGLTSPAILQIIEALDPQRQCFQYWAAKKQIEPQTSEAQTHTSAVVAAQNPGNKNHGVLRDTQAYGRCNNNNIAMGNVAMKLARPNQTRANVHLERNAVNPSSSSLGDKRVEPRSGSVVGPQSCCSSGTVVDSYPVLRTLFHKASTEELSVLHQLFASDRKSCDWNSGVSALFDELKSRIP